MTAMTGPSEPPVCGTKVIWSNRKITTSILSCLLMIMKIGAKRRMKAALSLQVILIINLKKKKINV